jgi:hypothetical protein
LLGSGIPSTSMSLQETARKTTNPGRGRPDEAAPPFRHAKAKAFMPLMALSAVEQARNHPYQTTECSRYEFSQGFPPPASAYNQYRRIHNSAQRQAHPQPRPQDPREGASPSPTTPVAYPGQSYHGAREEPVRHSNRQTSASSSWESL